MQRTYFDDSKKGIYYFTEDVNETLTNAKIGSETSIVVKDINGEIITIWFRVTRNAHLGSKTQWIYGSVLNALDDKYRQIEFKLHNGEPERDTIEVFLQAPPIIDMLR